MRFSELSEKWYSEGPGSGQPDSEMVRFQVGQLAGWSRYVWTRLGDEPESVDTVTGMLKLPKFPPPQNRSNAVLDHLASKMLNSLTCTDLLADLFKKKGDLFAPSCP